MSERSVDLMYLAWNRLEFTQATFSTLLSNTDWDRVHELFVYDDGSTDGTRQWLEANFQRAPAPARLVPTHFGSPVTAMVHFIQSASAPILAKVDNDAMLPPRWLSLSLDTLARHPELTLLGIEALYPHSNDLQQPRDYAPAEFISGLGLYRRSAFARGRPRTIRRYFGLEEWQLAQGAGLVRGWITPALPVFLLDRMPLSPWLELAEQYARRGWQRTWPKYSPACTLWHWCYPPAFTAPTPRPSAALAGAVRFMGAMRIKNEAAHIREVLERALSLCQTILVLDDHSTDDTLSICRSFGERVTVFSSAFEGLNEARDKNFLLQKVIAANPDWVLWIDGDEALEKAGAEKLTAAAAAQPAAAAFSLRVAYLWNDAEHVRTDGVYGQFRRPSVFRLRGQHTGALQFRATGFGGNFHCGNTPQGLAGPIIDLDVRLKHYGYMRREQRLAKYDWYRAMDPNNQIEDNYRHLAEIPGARHAPGPAVLAAWVE